MARRRARPARGDDRTVARAQRDLNIARAPSPIAAYGTRLILYDDRLSTPARTFALVSSVRAELTDRAGDPSSVNLVVEGPGWRELVTGPKRDEQILRQLAGAVDQAAREVDAVSTARKPEREFAEGRLAAARVERLGIADARPLLDRLAQLNEGGESVLDMAPGITTGHDGVLVVTSRRLLFVGLRHTLLIPYDQVQDVTARGKLLGARLIVSTPGQRHVVVAWHPGTPRRSPSSCAGGSGRARLSPNPPTRRPGGRRLGAGDALAAGVHVPLVRLDGADSRGSQEAAPAPPLVCPDRSPRRVPASRGEHRRSSRTRQRARARSVKGAITRVVLHAAAW